MASDNVLVTCVAPGRIATARTEAIDLASAEKSGKPLEEVRKEKVAAVPLARYGDTAEFGAMVAFLASERASYLTGSLFRVDGGFVSGI